MTNNVDIETKVIERFVIKTKQERYKTFIQSEKGRKKFIDDLHHMNFVDLNVLDKVESNEYDTIKAKIKNLGKINECYVISENKNIDQKRLDIDKALRETIGADLGTILVFGDAEVVYIEAEGFKNRWLSK